MQPDYKDLEEKYKKEVIFKMIEKFGYKNVMAVPKIEKVIINTCFGKLIYGKSSKEQEEIKKAISEDLAMITSQKPIFTKARKSISGFKIKKGGVIGAKVTLRRRRMYDFLKKLIHIVLPRSRDFKGIEKSSFDKKGI